MLTKSCFCGISAGTEMGFYRGTAPHFDLAVDSHINFSEAKGNIRYPMQSNNPGVWWMGYSNVSKVIEVGKHIKNFLVGDYIFSKSSHKTHHLLTEKEAVKIPQSNHLHRYALGALIEIAFNAIMDAGLVPGDWVSVMGMGLVGQLILQLAKHAGCKTIAIDKLPNRLELAVSTGADHIINIELEDAVARLHQITGGRGADVVIEASGNESSLETAIRQCSYNGSVVVVSFYQKPAGNLFLGREFHHKRTKLISSQIGGINPSLSPRWTAERRLATALEFLKTIDADSLISHEISFDDLPEYLALLDNQPQEFNAVVITY